MHVIITAVCSVKVCSPGSPSAPAALLAMEGLIGPVTLSPLIPEVVQSPVCRAGWQAFILASFGGAVGRAGGGR